MKKIVFKSIPLLFVSEMHKQKNPKEKRYGVNHSRLNCVAKAKVLEWVAISFSRGSSGPRHRTQVSCIAGRHFTLWATREAHIGPISMINQISLSGRSKNKQSKHSSKNTFWILRHSLMRNQIFSLISKGFYLLPSREIMRSMMSRAVLLGDF